MITIEDVHYYKVWYDSYTNNFSRKYPELIENIDLKIVHSKNVANEIVEIAKSLELSKEDMLLAEIIGFFHDIGRFRQYVKFQTFSDSKSQNHAELGVEVLKEYKLLDNLSSEEQEIVYNAILNHGKAEISNNQNKRELLFARLIRDADKLDIWRLVTEYYMVKDQKPARPAGGENKSIELELPDDPNITDKVLEAIINKKVILKEWMKTLNDFKLMQIGWLFDLNFDYSVKQVYNRKYLEKIFATLPDNAQVHEVKKVVDSYFNDRIELLTYK